MSEPLVPEDLLAFRMAADVQVSPDGRLVAFVLVWMDAAANQQRAAVWLVPADGSQPARQLTDGGRRDSRPRWSPDGTRLAFLSNRRKEWADDLYVLDMRGGEPRLAAQLPRGIAEYEWSPDGSRFCLLGRPAYPVDPRRPAPADEDEARRRYLDRACHVERMHYRADGPVLLDDEPRQVWVCPASGGEPVPVTEGRWEVHRPRWTADGGIAFLSNRSGDERVDALDLWRVPAEGGAPERLTAEARITSAHAPAPGGGWALVGTENPADYGSGKHWRLYVDGACRTADLDRTLGAAVLCDTAPAADALDPRWTPDGRWVYFQVSDQGSVHLYRAPRDDGSWEPVLGGRRAVLSYSVGGTTLAFTSTSEEDPLSVRASGLDGSGERVLFDPNPWVAERALGCLRELHVEADGQRVDGWALLPPGHREGERVPTLLYVHGGPHAAYGWSFQLVFQILAGAGYAVVFCNPPGSQSYPEDFVRALHARWGELDTPFFMAALDRAVEEGFADPERLGLGGASYGGYATLWLVAHSDRFRAAVAARPVSNLQSFYGSSDIGWNFSPSQMRAEPWQDPELYWRLSPVHLVERIATPLRLIASTGDVRTPHEEAEQVYVRLRKLGREVDLVLFQGEPHGMVLQGRPWNRVRHLEAVLEWFDRHLKPASP
jgi:dipeptidyl aminopeptidase/acylaminoacyl peptidase